VVDIYGGWGGGICIEYGIKYVLCLKTETAHNPCPDVSQTQIELPRQGRDRSLRGLYPTIPTGILYW